MKKIAAIIAGAGVAVITFMLLSSVFASEPEDLFDVKETTEILKDFEIIYLPPVEYETVDIEDIIAKSIGETENEPQFAEETKPQNIYKIKSGDSFWSIAQKFYDDGTLCHALAKYNDLTIDSLIVEGHKLIIPYIEDEEFAEIISNNKKVVTTESTTKASIATTYTSSPKVDITIPTGNDMRNYTGEVDVSSYEYIGDYKITGYDPVCAHCCGGNTHGIGASGAKVVPGYSVATKELPFDLTLYIEGYGYYVTEDTGCGEGVIDIVCPSHEACYLITNMEGVAVYIVE